MTPPTTIQHPRPGMLATIRNRRGLIATVEPFDSPEGRLHLVRVEYTDSDGVAEDTVLWEREHGVTGHIISLRCCQSKSRAFSQIERRLVGGVGSGSGIGYTSV